MALPIPMHRLPANVIHPRQMVGENIAALGHDAGLVRGRTFGINDDSGHVDAASVERGAQTPGRLILAQQAHDDRFTAQAADVGGGIGRAPRQVVRLRLLQHRHRRFPAQAMHPADQVFVQEEVANDQDATFGETSDNGGIDVGHLLACSCG